MPGTLSSSPKKDQFKEYLRLHDKSDKVDSTIVAIDSLCVEIARQEFKGIDKANAFKLLYKIAIGLPTADDFFEFFSNNTFHDHHKKNKPGDSLKNAYKLFFDFVDTDYTEKSFASYMVGRYRLGYIYLARYWAAVLFDQIIERKAKLLDSEAWLNKKNEPGRNGYDPTLYDNIKLLSENTLKQDSIYNNDDVFKRYHDRNFNMSAMSKDKNERIEQTRERLLNFNQLRNDIAHDVKQKEGMKDNNLELVYYVWCELLQDEFNYYKQFFLELDKENSLTQGNHSIIDAINELEADFMVREIDETAKIDDGDSKFEAIKKSVFEDLSVMRKKLLPLRALLFDWLRWKHKYSGLTTDILTTIDTTSAYIWMPLVPYDLQVVGRQGIFNCSVSILVTPHDFRIYMDFGGYAKTKRSVYYKFLESDEYSKFMESFDGKAEMKVFDIDWFSFIANCSKLTSQNVAKNALKIDDAKDKLNEPVSLPITWNRMLHGYILEKNNIPDDGISLNWIKERLTWIIKFYDAFRSFEEALLPQEGQIQ